MNMWGKIIFLCGFLFKFIEAIPKNIPICGSNGTKMQLCSLYDKYDKGRPDYERAKTPMKLSTELTLASIDDFDEEHGTLSLSFLLDSSWNDTRITLESLDQK